MSRADQNFLNQQLLTASDIPGNIKEIISLLKIGANPLIVNQSTKKNAITNILRYENYTLGNIVIKFVFNCLGAIQKTGGYYCRSSKIMNLMDLYWIVYDEILILDTYGSLKYNKISDIRSLIERRNHDVLWKFVAKSSYQTYEQLFAEKSDILFRELETHKQDILQDQQNSSFMTSIIPSTLQTIQFDLEITQQIENIRIPSVICPNDDKEIIHSVRDYRKDMELIRASSLRNNHAKIFDLLYTGTNPFIIDETTDENTITNLINNEYFEIADAIIMYSVDYLFATKQVLQTEKNQFTIQSFAYLVSRISQHSSVKFVSGSNQYKKTAYIMSDVRMLNSRYLKSRGPSISLYRTYHDLFNNQYEIIRNHLRIAIRNNLIYHQQQSYKITNDRN